ncbi:hypothetical protein ACQE3E_15520 [Methylomonas sp. MED-D]|uniref:hypothetical protein n=1 Tax=unclassified Methylomonas TaxID=2608980 RepID=UPI003D06DC4E
MAANIHDMQVNRRMGSADYIDHVNRRVNALQQELAAQKRQIETLKDDLHCGWAVAGVLLAIVLFLLMIGVKL